MSTVFEKLSAGNHPEFFTIIDSVKDIHSIKELPPPPSIESSHEFQEWIVKCALCSPIREILKDFSPCKKANSLSKINNNTIYLKREECSPVYSFKLRGAFTKISSLSPEQAKAGVYTCSAGNHAQGVAYSASHFGISSKIYMPTGAPSIKIDSVKSMGGEIFLTGETLDDCFDYSNTVNDGRVLIHPFDDPYVVGGQATVALELLQQVDIMSIDYLFAPCGGGGIIAGVGNILKLINPNIKIIGVEASEAPGMTESLKEGKVKTLHNIGKFADGAAIKTIGKIPFKIAQKLIDEMILVSTSEICQAISESFVDIRMILEPAGALGVAGLKKYCKENGIKNKNCIVITTGANIDFKLLKFIYENSTVTEHRFSIQLPEHPGSVKALITFLKDNNITGIAYNHSHPDSKKYSNLILSINIDNLNETETLLNVLKQKGYDPWEITNNELANYHAKPSGIGGESLKENEIILRFEYSNKSEKTQQIFNEISESWDLSRLHYEYGTENSHLLMGVYTNSQSKPEIENFLKNISNLGIKYADETNNPLIHRLVAA